MRRDWVALSLARRRKNGTRLRAELERLCERALEGPNAHLRKALVAYRQRWVTAAMQREAEAVLAHCDAEAVRVLHPECPNYPSALLRLPDPPLALFARGRVEALQRRCVGVVGSRRVRPWAEGFAASVGRGARRAGLTLVAGHTSACEEAAAFAGATSRGLGLVVLVEAYGPVGGRLRHGVAGQALAAGGLVLSALPPGVGRAPYAHALRSRLLGSLVDDLVVVQAQAGSGALSAVDAALEAQAEIWVAGGSGRLEDSLGAGGAALIYEGAHLLQHPLPVLWPGLPGPPWRPRLVRALERSGPLSPDGLLAGFLGADSRDIESLLSVGWLRWSGDGRLQPGYEPFFRAMQTRHAKFAA